MFNDKYYEYVKTLNLTRFDKKVKFKEIYKQLDISEYDLKFMMMSKKVDWIIALPTLNGKNTFRNHYWVDSKKYYEYLVNYQKNKLELITSLVGIKEQEARLKKIEVDEVDLNIKTKVPIGTDNKDLILEVQK